MIPDYTYRSAQLTWAHQYLDAAVVPLLKRHVPDGGSVFELGCGNGSFANILAQAGYQVTAVDPSESGVAQARAAFAVARFERGSTDEDLAERFGRFDAVVSLEVVEHCYSPRMFAKRVFDLLKDGGVAVISTPYHGYWKNLALALTNRLDRHMNPLWEGGHIKFFSRPTLTQLLQGAGLSLLEFQRVGRWPPVFAKSMIAVARRQVAKKQSIVSDPMNLTP